MKPTAILEKLCKEAGLEPPLYQPGYVIVAEQRFYEQELVENEQGLSVTLFVFIARQHIDKAILSLCLSVRLFVRL